MLFLDEKQMEKSCDCMQWVAPCSTNSDCMQCVAPRSTNCDSMQCVSLHSIKLALDNTTDVKFEIFTALQSRMRVSVMWCCYWAIYFPCSEWTQCIHLQGMKGQRTIPHIRYSSLHDMTMEAQRRGKGVAPTHSQPWWVISTMLLSLYLQKRTRNYYRT
jgi:hypothetical protein